MAGYLSTSRILRLFPLSFDLGVGAIMVGNKQIPSLLTLKFDSGKGLYGVCEVCILSLHSFLYPLSLPFPHPHIHPSVHLGAICL